MNKWLALLLFVAMEFPAQARRAYFIGTAGYNDNGIDVNAQSLPGVPLSGGSYGDRDSGGTGSMVSFKLFSCNLMIANLSKAKQRIVGYGVTINYLSTSHARALGGGPPLDSIDPLRHVDGSDVAWRNVVINSQWNSGDATRPSPPYQLYKFDHSTETSDFAPSIQNQGHTGSAPLALNPNETAYILVGNEALTGGGLYTRGIYNETALPGSSQWPWKQLATCMGYIDIEDDSPTKPGFVMASGTFESKAGSHLNRSVVYGGRSLNQDTPGATGIHDYFGYFKRRPANRLLTISNACSTASGVPTNCDGDASQEEFPSSAPTAWNQRGFHDLYSSGPPFFDTDIASFPRDGLYNYGAGIRTVDETSVDNMFAGFENVACSVQDRYDILDSEAVVTANYPEVLFNTPILINGGSPF